MSRRQCLLASFLAFDKAVAEVRSASLIIYDVYRTKVLVKPLPTDAELEILKVLWERGASTVREVFDAMQAATGYTTALKTMQIMFEKGLVTRDDSARSHVYTAAVQAEATQGQLVSELIDRAFDGSATRLAMRALSAEPVSSDELSQIRALLDQLEKKGTR